MRAHGHAQVDPSNPSAFGTCDRCSRLFNLSSLAFQHDWRGQAMVNIQRRVCPSCMDIPQPQLRPVILSPDPVPVFSPRPEQYGTEDEGISATQSALPPGFGPVILEN